MAIEQTAHKRHYDHYGMRVDTHFSKISHIPHYDLVAATAISEDLANIKLGWMRAVDTSDIDALDTYFLGLAWFYEARSLFLEGQEIFKYGADRLRDLNKAIDQPTEIMYARVLAQYGRYCRLMGDFAEAEPSIQESYDLLRASNAPHHLATALNLLIEVTENYAIKQQLCKEMLALYPVGDDQPRWMLGVENLFQIALARGDYREARRLRIEFLICDARRARDKQAMAYSLIDLGTIALALGNYHKARSAFQQCLKYAIELSNLHLLGAAQSRLGLVVWCLGDRSRARELLQESITSFESTGDSKSVAYVKSDLGFLWALEGDYNQANKILNESLAAFEDNNSDSHFFSARATIYTYQGHVAWMQRDYATARKNFYQALNLIILTGITIQILATLVGIAAVFAEQGKSQEAMEIFALVRYHPASEQRTRDRAQELLHELQMDIPVPLIKSVQQGTGRNIDEIVEAVLLSNL